MSLSNHSCSSLKGKHKHRPPLEDIVCLSLSFYVCVPCIFAIKFLCRIFFLNPRSLGGLKPPPLRFVGGWLLTSPEEELNRHRGEPQPMTDSDSENHSSTGGTQVRIGVHCLKENRYYHVCTVVARMIGLFVLMCCVFVCLFVDTKISTK